MLHQLARAEGPVKPELDPEFADKETLRITRPNLSGKKIKSDKLAPLAAFEARMFNGHPALKSLCKKVCPINDVNVSDLRPEKNANLRKMRNGPFQRVTNKSKSK